MTGKDRATLRLLKGKDFVGWHTVARLVDEPVNTQYYAKPNPWVKAKGMTEAMKRKQMREKLQFRDRGFMSSLMLTGGRLEEVLMLNLHHFRLSEDKEFILVKHMPLLKQYERNKELVDVIEDGIPQEPGYQWDAEEQVFKKYEYTTTPKLEERQEFPIPLWEPISFVLEEYLDARDDSTPEGYWGWLFPTTKKDTRQEYPGVQKWMDEVFNIPRRAWISPQMAHRIVVDVGNRVGVRIWGHWFRAQRAKQLSRDYRFETRHLNRYFGWQAVERDTADEYASEGLYDLMDLMLENKKRHEDYANRDFARGEQEAKEIEATT